QGYKTSLMHCYEVIPEKDACKLYFDLEFHKAANPGADGKDMVAKLIELVSQKLKELYDVNCSASDVLNLDSSTDEKFSRHLIFLPCKTVFKDNIHVGHFVRTILQPAIRLMESNMTAGGVGHTSQSSAPTVEVDGSLRNLTAVKDASTAGQANETETSHHGESSDFSFLIVNNKEGGKQLFVDLGVYTKNRNFRMYKSSKAGKNVILKIAEDNKFIPNCEENISLEEAYFLSSLVCNVRSKDGIKILSSSFPEEERKTSAFLRSTTTRSTRESMEGYQDSPYPEIDCFVHSLINKDGVQGDFPLPPRICLSSLFVEEEENTAMDERENTEEKVTPHSNPADLSESSASLEKNMPQDTQWDNASDDAYLAETTEDVELAEAANESLGYDVEEIPDEVLLEVSWEQDTWNKDDS
ncbi:UNVERIFIED_CONTAM: hypothetical protein H355_016243, partial [Colinus virginianus]